MIQSLLEDVDDDLVQQALLEAQGKEELLVWNLESVQGHERDIILFSVAFAKNERGQVPLNFGPLNQIGGQRRLNVAVTRARRQVIVFCSFEPAELKAEGSTSTGLKHLKAYLELARNGAETSGSISGHAVRAPDRHRDAVLAALRSRGAIANPDVGMSDFKVDIAIEDPDDPGRYILGILLDGERWRTRKTVGDRDALPTSLLQNKMGWAAIERIWLPTWLRDQEGETDRIMSVVDQVVFERKQSALTIGVEAGLALGGLTSPLIHGTGEGAIRSEPADTLEDRVLAGSPVVTPGRSVGGTLVSPIQPEPAGRAERPDAGVEEWPHITTWSAWAVEATGDPYLLDQLFDPETVSFLQSIAQKIIRVEGPLEPNRFARLIGQACGMHRVVAKRAEEILAMPLPALVRDDEGFFYLSENGPKSYRIWSKSSPGEGRPIEEISLTELGNAMRDIARVGLGAGRDELARATAQVFGISRLTVGIRDRLESAIDAGLARGILGLRGEHVVAL